MQQLGITIRSPRRRSVTHSVGHSIASALAVFRLITNYNFVAPRLPLDSELCETQGPSGAWRARLRPQQLLTEMLVEELGDFCKGLLRLGRGDVAIILRMRLALIDLEHGIDASLA
jgi:hypothetical protein